MSDQKTILLVEDEELFRGMLADLLRFDDYRVLDAGSGDTALAAAESHGGTIDLLITDINLYGITGLELADKLAERHSNLGVLYMSGDTLEGAAGEANVRPDAHFLQKPFEASALLDKVRQIL